MSRRQGNSFPTHTLSAHGDENSLPSVLGAKVAKPFGTSSAFGGAQQASLKAAASALGGVNASSKGLGSVMARPAVATRGRVRQFGEEISLKRAANHLNATSSDAPSLDHAQKAPKLTGTTSSVIVPPANSAFQFTAAPSAPAPIEPEPMSMATPKGALGQPIEHVEESELMAAGVEAMTMAQEFGSPIKDIDAGDWDDPQLAAEYVEDVYEYFRENEHVNRPSSAYMSKQPDINPKMRSILINWMVDVHLKFRFLPETLYLTVNIMDRFLCKKAVGRTKLQLVGVTSMLIAAKYEEIYPPEVRDLVLVTDKAYTREEIIAMESLILKVLAFELNYPTQYFFLNRVLKAAEADTVTVVMSGFFSECMLQEYRFLAFTPSAIAAAAGWLANKSCGRKPWTSTLTHYTGYTEESLEEPVNTFLAFLRERSSTNAIRKKYSKKLGVPLLTACLQRLAM